MRQPWIGGLIGATVVLLLAGAVLTRLRLFSWESVLLGICVIWIFSGLRRVLGSVNTSSTENALSAAAPLFDRVEDAVAREPSWDPTHLRPQTPGEIVGVYRGRTTTLTQRVWPSGTSEAYVRDTHHTEFRIACDSPLRFTCKSWEVSAGPPFGRVRMAAEFRDQPVDLLTADMDSFAFWRDRADFRAAAEPLIVRDGLLAITVAPGWLTAWWNPGPNDTERMSAVLPQLAELAAMAEQR